MVLKKFHQDTTKLVPGDLKLISPKELSQYYIEDTKLLYFSPGKTYLPFMYPFIIPLFFSSYSDVKILDNHKEGIKMEITFKRRLTNELMTTFVPSFFLLGICYATTYFKPFYFEANVTVNLTVMLVATTLFIRYSIFL